MNERKFEAGDRAVLKIYGEFDDGEEIVRVIELLSDGRVLVADADGGDAYEANVEDMIWLDPADD